jgi:hypothetical protein
MPSENLVIKSRVAAEFTAHIEETTAFDPLSRNALESDAISDRSKSADFVELLHVDRITASGDPLNAKSDSAVTNPEFF